MVEILTMGVWTGVVWWLSWATCARLHRQRRHMYSRRLHQELARAEAMTEVMTNVSIEQAAEIAELKFTAGQR